MDFDPTKPFEVESVAEPGAQAQAPAAAFDPSQPFAVEAASVQPSGFDPSQPFEVEAAADEGPGAVRAGLNAFARYMWNIPNAIKETGLLGAGGALGSADEARLLREEAARQESFAEKGFMPAENRSGAVEKRRKAEELEATAAATVAETARSRALAEEFFPKSAAEKEIAAAKGVGPTLKAMVTHPEAALAFAGESAVPVAKGAATALVPGGWIAKVATASGLFGSDAYAAQRAAAIQSAILERGVDPEDRDAVLAVLRDPKFLDEAERKAKIAGTTGAVVGAMLPVTGIAGQAAERAVAGRLASGGVVSPVASAAAQAAGVTTSAVGQGVIDVGAGAVEQLASEGRIDAGELAKRGVSSTLMGGAFEIMHAGEGVRATRERLARERAASEALMAEAERVRAAEEAAPTAPIVEEPARAPVAEEVAARPQEFDPTKPFTEEAAVAVDRVPPVESAALEARVPDGDIFEVEADARGGRTMPLAAEARPTPGELAIEEARRAPEPYRPTPEEEAAAADPRSMARRIVDSVKKAGTDKLIFVRDMATARGVLPETVFHAKEAAQGAESAVAFDVQGASKRLKSAMKAEGVDLKDPLAMRRVNAALAGDRASLAALTPKVAAQVSVMRSVIDGMTAKLIEAGAIPSKLTGALEANLGVYLNRSYRLFDDPKWADKVSPAVRNKVGALFMREMPGMSRLEAEGYVNNLLHREDGPMAQLAKMGKREQSILMKRGEIAPEVRALWGEYEDPLVNFSRSVMKMNRLLEAHKLQLAIEKEGVGKFLFTAPTETHFAQVGGAERGAFKALEEAKRGARELTADEAAARMAGEEPGVKPMTEAEKDRSLGPLAKYYTTPELARALRDINGEGEAVNGVMRQLLKASGWVQHSNTVQSWVTHIRNVVGNVAIMAGNGHYRVGKTSDGFRMIREMVGKPGAFEARARRYAELGITGDSFNAGILREHIKRAGGDEAVWFGKALESTNKIYGLEDDFFKVYAFENELANQRKAYPGQPEAALEARAAEVVKNTVPTFSRAGAGVKAFRRQPLLGNFVAFPAEMIRTTANTYAQAGREIKEGVRTGNRALVEVGARRMASVVLMTAVLPAALEEWSRQRTGMTEDEAAANRELLPEFMRDQPVIWIGKGAGKVRALSQSGINPYVYFNAPAVAAMRMGLEDAPDAGVGERAMRGAARFLQPFTDERILTGRLLDVARNKDGQTGAEIYNPTDSAAEKWAKGVGHVAVVAAPGAARTGERLYKAETGVIEDSSRTFNKDDERRAALSGQRVTEVDVDKAVSRRFRDFNSREAQASGPLHDVVRAITNGATSGTAEALVNAWQETQDRRWREYAAMHRTARAAIVAQQGSAQRLLSAMKESKMGSEEAEYILAGRFRPSVPAADPKFAAKLPLVPNERKAREEIARRMEVYRRASLTDEAPRFEAWRP